MKRIALFFLLTLFILTPSAFSQDDDWYRPGGFDAIGRSYKTFSVSDTKKVHFSRGNLQYNASQNKWRFALRQYTYVCSDNANAAQDYDGWIDFFGWGTSGWNSGASAYQPWSTVGYRGNYYLGGDANNTIFAGGYENADWGVYNKISNGGNKAGQWRTLTGDEWDYVVGDNATRSGKWGVAIIQGIYKGLILLPDDWTAPSNMTFTPGHSQGYALNEYTLAEWERIQASGAVFLPAAGCRLQTDIDNSNNIGYYWASTSNAEEGAHLLYIDGGWHNLTNFSQDYGCSVRLVADENPNVSKAFDLEGASYKTFSVADGRTVHFSKGNLRYNAATNTWAFAAKQYLYIGDANSNISESYNGWIDLFGWGTSGWNSGATAFQPWSTSTTDADYYPGGSATNNLTGDYAQADWGVYNKITNGGNKADKWRTLTKDEWVYLLGDNATRSGKYGLATINTASKSYTGMVILPDDWSLPNGVTFTAGYGDGFITNTYTTAQWQKMESAGALFLPAAGYRDGTNVQYIGTNCRYWSTYSDGRYAYGVYIAGSHLDLNYSFGYRGGFSVRLVKD